MSQTRTPLSAVPVENDDNQLEDAIGREVPICVFFRGPEERRAASFVPAGEGVRIAARRDREPGRSSVMQCSLPYRDDSNLGGTRL